MNSEQLELRLHDLTVAIKFISNHDGLLQLKRQLGFDPSTEEVADHGATQKSYFLIIDKKPNPYFLNSDTEWYEKWKSLSNIEKGFSEEDCLAITELQLTMSAFENKFGRGW